MTASRLQDSTRPSVGYAEKMMPVAATVDQCLGRLEFIYQVVLIPVGVYGITEMAGSDHHPLITNYAFSQ